MTANINFYKNEQNNTNKNLTLFTKPVSKMPSHNEKRYKYVIEISL